jgi:spermidine synthase
MDAEYTERDDTLSVTYVWHNCRIVHRQTTARGTLVEIVDRPVWGLSCFMDGVVQSCETDEALYHHALVKAALWPLTREQRRSVCIFGGGEGATAREVLRHNGVEQVDMYEWDAEVVQLFRDRLRSWGQITSTENAWDSPKLHLFHEDAFQIRGTEKPLHYDAVIIDLFDLDEASLETWLPFLENAAAWCRHSICLYVTTQAPLPNPHSPLVGRIRRALRTLGFSTHHSSVYVPSFHGYATFLSGSRKA